MVKLISKLLSLSNSYNYYKSNYEIIKKQIDQEEIKKENEEREKQKKTDIILEHLQIIRENQNEVRSLQDYINKNVWNLENILNKGLENLQQSQNEIKNEYNIIKNDIYENRILQNLTVIKNDSKNRKINIVFIINFQISVMDELIRLLSEDPLFNTTIVIIPYDPHGLNLFDSGLDEYQLKDYNENYEYFNEMECNVIRGYDEKSKSLVDIDNLRPDIIFYATPWEVQLPKQFRIENLSKNILFCYIPYGIYAAQMQEDQFNRWIHNKAWKIFSETKIHKLLAAQYSDTGSSNVVVTGYPKMDPLINGSHVKNPYPWKDSSHQKKRIIWAPHHSIGSAPTAFSTFDKNYKFFYNYAKTHTEIEWVFKPHPALRHASIFFPEGQAGDFSVENLSNYYDSWENLPNAIVHEGGDYFNLFATSDAMIMDSVSFLSEYLYVGKPGLFLTRPEQKFNEFGEIIKNAWYQADGNDFNQIEMFINDVVVNEDDKLRNIREDIYSQYLDTGGITASSKIYSYIKGSITNESMED
jgi:hypothetical protein